MSSPNNIIEPPEPFPTFCGLSRLALRLLYPSANQRHILEMVAYVVDEGFDKRIVHSLWREMVS